MKILYIGSSSINDIQQEIVEGTSLHNSLEECKAFYSGVIDEPELMGLKYFKITVEEVR